MNDPSLDTETGAKYEALRRLYSQGEFESLRRECERLLLINANDGVANEFLAHCALADDDRISALNHFLTASSVLQNNAGILSNIGALLIKSGKPNEALKYLEKSISLAPDRLEYQYMRGEAYKSLRRFDDAIACYKNILTKNPRHNLSILALVRYYIDTYELETAAKLLDESPSLDKDSTGVIGLRAEIERTLGRWESSRELLKESLSTKTECSGLATLYLYSLNFSEILTREEIFQEHRRMGDLHFTPLSTRSMRATCPGDRLRIGFVSPDFRTHSVAYFADALYRYLDRKRVSLFSYYNHAKSDEHTDKFRALSDKWTVVDSIPAKKAAGIIANDDLDILVDLAGHTRDNRLDIFRYQPARRLVTYLGYPNTTGLPTMDFRISDAYADPPGSGDRLNTEILIRLPHTFLCYTPPVELTITDRVPCLTRGYVTFGCFNVDLKINSTILALWKEILNALPQSRLAIKTHTNTTVHAKNLLEKRCRAAGLDITRVDILPAAQDTASHLSVYNYIDIALDTFPYQGTTTTCEALWMGVPVISLEGDRHASRVGTSLLSNAGLPELIARSPVAYIELAIKLASDPHRLDSYRAKIRGMMQRSPLMNHRQFANQFLDACEAILNTPIARLRTP